ncbi:Phosphoribosylformylglycinamidine synthase subunit PurQ [Geodia barretti]|uniref:Phosphoribosylformylglycinamidine synthase subunit PurQ n=1 Tax=Geodia barretti TaxID=519541 RepID=A0AA35WJ75_GEOBA|nr:Phosphoribosylformylglycinamidine synthase subunit PurQ [Geodia barretti]
MALKETLTNDLRNAMRQRDNVKRDTIRLLLSAIGYEEKAQRTDALEDDTVMQVLSKQAQQRRESIEAYQKGNRPDLVAKEEAELVIVSEYLPQPLSADEIQVIVQSAIAEVNATGPQDMGKVMGKIMPQPVEYVWHKDTDLSPYDCIILPGGFSYGDYLRPGAIARFSPAMQAVTDFAANGGLVIGICNGFQILCEAGLLPGVLLPNDHLQFRCQWTTLRVENANTAFTGASTVGQTLRSPNFSWRRELLRRSRCHRATGRAQSRGFQV